LDQQVACQRYRQNILDATSKIRDAVVFVSEGAKNLAAALTPQLAPALV